MVICLRALRLCRAGSFFVSVPHRKRRLPLSSFPVMTPIAVTSVCPSSFSAVCPYLVVDLSKWFFMKCTRIELLAMLSSMSVREYSVDPVQ